ncbi:hypothetical protein [Staphylococcus felis]|uniref:hypothetical protein n=1 Tax=Staphylococcus felis TaxID=46127 RepID=UPI0021D10B45|nr:hypothetical protein [Staphylococcus felis]UXR86600.1 hypothetical protein MUA17_11320 [Staphylococcus felis]
MFRIQAEWNDEQNCSPNFEELRSYTENSACETPSIKVVERGGWDKSAQDSSRME